MIKRFMSDSSTHRCTSLTTTLTVWQLFVDLIIDLMSRSCPYRLEISDACSWHQDEALNSSLYILLNTGPTGFLLKEENEAKNFKVKTNSLYLAFQFSFDSIQFSAKFWSRQDVCISLSLSVKFKKILLFIWTRLTQSATKNNSTRSNFRSMQNQSFFTCLVFFWILISN